MYNLAREFIVLNGASVGQYDITSIRYFAIFDIDFVVKQIACPFEALWQH